MKTLIALLSLALAAFSAVAQEWPTRPIRIVMPFGPGGVVESVFAAIHPQIESKLGQRILVENRPGGGGNVGAQSVLAAPADGYTILVAPNNVIVINPYLFEKTSFDPLKDFLPITKLMDVPLVISVSAKLPISSVKELIDYAKANPGKVNYASPGPATPPHLAGEMFARAADVQMVHIPYKGGNAAATALITNEVQVFIVAYASLRGQIQGGLVRPIAAASPQRLAALPNVPTVAESGYPKIEAEIHPSWWGLFAPRGTPDAVISRLYNEYRAALTLPEAQSRLREAGLVAGGNRPAEFAASLLPQAASWETTVKALGIKVN